MSVLSLSFHNDGVRPSQGEPPSSIAPQGLIFVSSLLAIAKVW